jgi:hypothetical protein
MKTRLAIAIGTALVSTVIIIFAFGVQSQNTSSLLLNLGTELIGIGITILIIDWILEKRRFQDSARKLASVILRQLDHHVWVWQGGAREFDYVELSWLLKHVDDNDPIPSFTQNLFLRLGSDAATTLDHASDVANANKSLMRGLRQLTQLLAIRDRPEPMMPTEIARHITQAVEYLAEAAGLSKELPDIDVPPQFRNSSIKMQEWRHFGERGTEA